MASCLEPAPALTQDPPRPRGPLALCLLASAALHLVLMSELPSIALQGDPATPELAAELVRLEPKPLALPPPVAAMKPAPKPRAAPAPAMQRSVPPPPVPVAPGETVIAAADVPEVEPVAAAESAPAETAEAAPAAPETPEPVPPVAAAEPAPDPPAPQVGTIRYEVYYGADAFSVGRSVQTWSIDKDTYRLTSFSETTGLFGVFKPLQFAYVAEGRVEPGRLRPDTFTVRRGREGERQASARFDWASGELTFGSARSPRKAPLNGNTYDFLTLFYQLPHMPLAPGLMQVAVTTGTRFSVYQLQIGPEEMLELPIGTVRAIPIKQVRTAGQESIEVWLAPEQRYLPVRIRMLDEQGKLRLEHLATRIAVGTLAADGR